jgi:hypothetical protein
MIAPGRIEEAQMRTFLARVVFGVVIVGSALSIGSDAAVAHDFLEGHCCCTPRIHCDTANPASANPACHQGHSRGQQFAWSVTGNSCGSVLDCFGEGCGLAGPDPTCEPEIKPNSVPEIAGNGLDDDCDGLVDETVIKTPDGCCCQDLGAACVARPGSADPLCQAGQTAITPVALCPGHPASCTSCNNVAGTPVGMCAPVIPSNATAEIPDNSKDDDCDGVIDDSGCNGVDNDGDGMINEDAGGCLMRILAVPVCWGGTDLAFRQAAQVQYNFFLTDLGVDACRSNFSLSIIDPSTANLSCGAANVFGSNNPMTGDTRCAVPENPLSIDTWGEELFGDSRVANSPGTLANLGLKRGNYDMIIAVTDGNLCDNVAGVNMGGGFIWTETGEAATLAHEIGHSYDLADEYCSQESMGDPRCAGGPTTGNPRINFLGSDLLCDPRNGNGCCTNCGVDAVAHPNQGSYYVCCTGNQNPETGTCTMSFTGAPGPRGYCARCQSQMNTPVNPRSPANKNGHQALSCAAARTVGAMNTMSMNMSVQADGHLMAVKQFTTDVGRAAPDAPVTHGILALSVKSPTGAMLYSTNFDPVRRDITNGGPPLPYSDVEDRGFRFVVPDGVSQTDKLKIGVSGTAGTFNTTLNGAAPSANAGADRILECVNGGATTALQGVVSDPDGDSVNVAWKTTAGTIANAQAVSTTGTFPVATTSVVTLSASDAVKPTVSDTLNVTVLDTTPPVLKAPADLTIPECVTPNLGSATVSDACGGTPSVSNDAPAKYPLGTTTVTWRAVDAYGNVATATQRVTVVANKSVTRLANGDMRYSITFPVAQAYVEAFVRQNGVQNVSGSIVSSKVANPDGTFTYSKVVTASHYHTGDVISVRFYSYKTVAPGVFTPGPTENLWYPDVIYGGSTQCLCGRTSEVLANGDVKVSINFTAAQQYVEAFVRANSSQVAAGAIQGIANFDGSFTYSRVVPASNFRAGNSVTYRFYEYMPNQPAVFSPGPTQNTWYPGFTYSTTPTPACP